MDRWLARVVVRHMNTTDDIDTTEATLADFAVDQRVELHPATDRWMMGDRYGTIKKLDFVRNIVRIKLDHSGKTLNFHPRNVLKKKL